MFPDKGESSSSVGIQKIEPSGLTSKYKNSEPERQFKLPTPKNNKPIEKSEMAKRIIKALGGRRDV